MARKKEAVTMPSSPKAPWESYDPLSAEVYGEPFEVQLPSDEEVAVPDAEDVVKDVDVEVPEAVEADASGAVDAPPEVDISGAAPIEAQELIPDWVEGQVETVAPEGDDEAIPEAEPSVKEVGPKAVRKRVASEPEKVVEPAKVEANGVDTPPAEKVMVPTKITRRRVVRRRKMVK